MFDDLRFAIKCGGSAKKVQLSGSTAVPLKKLSTKMMKKSASESSNMARVLQQQQQHSQLQQMQLNQSSMYMGSAGVARSGSTRSMMGVAVTATTTPGQQQQSGTGKSCKKCKEIIRNELLENINAENALVCKHDSTTNLSIHNPGLLIIDKDTAFDTQAALINSHMLPHSHIHISHQSADTTYNGGDLFTFMFISFLNTLERTVRVFN